MFGLSHMRIAYVCTKIHASQTLRSRRQQCSRRGGGKSQRCPVAVVYQSDSIFVSKFASERRMESWFSFLFGKYLWESFKSFASFIHGVKLNSYFTFVVAFSQFSFWWLTTCNLWASIRTTIGTQRATIKSETKHIYLTTQNYFNSECFLCFSSRFEMCTLNHCFSQKRRNRRHAWFSIMYAAF